MQLVDLSHTIAADISLFADNVPPPRISAWMSHAEAARSGRYVDCTCEISRLDLVTSAGTYLDSPYHFDPQGPAIEQMPLERLVLPGLVVTCTDCAPGQALPVDRLAGLDVAGKAVLFHTGWSRFWKQEAYRRHPFLTGAAAVALRDGGAALVGVDFLVADDTSNPRRPVHVTLLHAGIPIVENLTHLERLPPHGFTFHAAPVKVAGAAAFPVRAYGVI